MKVNAIKSASNTLLKRVRALHHRSHRDKLGQFILEGPKLVEEAFDKELDVKEVILSHSYWQDGIDRRLEERLTDINDVYVVEDKLFADLVTTATPCGVLALASKPRYKLSDCLKGDNTLLVIGEALQDPGNLGTIVRNCLAFGATGLVLTRGTVDPYNTKVVRSAMGALFGIPIVTDWEIGELLGELKEKQVKTVVLDAGAPRAIWQISMMGPVAFIFG
ncbi:MAG TPA: RNA methyltransferase, partial [Chroococcales cyanobacterium]